MTIQTCIIIFWRKIIFDFFGLANYITILKLTIVNSTYKVFKSVRLVKAPTGKDANLLLWRYLCNTYERKHSTHSFKHAHPTAAIIWLSHCSLSIPGSTECENWHSRTISDVLPLSSQHKNLFYVYEIMTSCRACCTHKFRLIKIQKTT